MKHSIKLKALSMTSVAMLAAAAITPMTVLTSCSKQKAEFFKVYENNNKGFEVEFCNKGASIYGIKYNGHYITYSPKAQSDFLNDKYFHGKGLGRVAGRIADGKFTMDGVTYDKLNVNETSPVEKGSKNNTLHGGKDGFSSQFFKYYKQDRGDFYTVAFNYVSADGEGGFPGVLDSWFVYNVYKEIPKMEINIIGIPSVKTPVDLTNHPYFRLPVNSGAQATDTILGHTLQISGEEVAVFRDKSSPQTGTSILTDQIVEGKAKVTDSKYTNFDFRIDQAAQTIGSRFDAVKAYDPVSGGYDHIWYMGEPKGTTEADLNKIVLENTDYKLTVSTDANAVIIYTNCWPYAEQGLKMNGAYGEEVDHLNGGITVEPFTFFKEGNLEEIYCTPDKPYTRKIIYELTAK